jgi:large repetitive protein
LATVRKSFLLAVAFVLAAVGLIVPAAAAGAGTPNIALEKHAPETALLGTKQQVQLVAKNPVGPKRGYNLTFRDVLPKGVAYVAGSAKVAPRVLENQPAVGMTTLIFENVADLSAKSEYDLGYEVEPLPGFFKIAEDPKYTNEAEAFVSERPRKKPRFNEKGEVVGTSFTGSATAKATTELTAIEIEKSEPSPEGEILRGVHEHQTVYTLHVRNNKVGPTQGVAGTGPGGKPAIVIEDWLPAGLEFLGCGETDNTTETSTNPGSAEEYPGSGPIDPGNAPAVPKCVEPFFVATEDVAPPGGKQPKAVYTHVKFLGPESLATGEEIELQYVTAIPILQNTVNWLGVEPTPASLGQIANLNNNSGPETHDEEQLTNVAQAQGEYESVPVHDTDEMTRTAEDLAIQKGTSPKQEAIFDGAETNWTLRLEASEYRRTEPVSITDQLPNGLCPRGPESYEGPTGGPITQPKTECEASGTLHPSVKYLKGGPAGKVGTEEPIEYSLAEEEATGGFKLEFNGTKVTALERLEPSQELLINFPTTTRTFYQENFEDAKPVLTGDSWTNEVKTEGQAFTRCFVEPATPDPNCEGPGAKPIVNEPVTGTFVEDVSAASQEAGTVTIQKTVRENDGKPVPKECEGEASEYVKGIVSAEEPKLPQYRPGDEICWRLVVNFSGKIYAGTPTVSDFIPPDEKYVQNSEVIGPENTVEAEFNEKAAVEEEALEWKITELGDESVKPGQIFEYRFKTKVETSSENEPGEITGNLMKFLYSNTEGQTFPLRDRAEVQRQEPELSLEKRITEVGGNMVPKPAPGEKSVAVAGGGETVKYALELENAGNLGAEEAEVWDVLPTGIECADITLPTQTAPQAASCDEAERTIKWTGVAIPEGALTTLTYEAKVPTDVAPGHSFINHAGVTRFKSQTNTPEKFEYIPEENINEELNAKANTGKLRAEAEVKTSAATLQKEATTETSQPGNLANQATIGELVDYKVTATIPANSKIYGAPVIKDVLPSTLKLEGAVVATLDGKALPSEGVTLNTLANGAEVLFGGAYPATPSAAEHKVVLTFKARVLNVAANERGKTITNAASFQFKDVEEGATTTVNKSVGTPVVEPEIKVTKKNLLPAGQTTVAPGEVVKYESEVSNLEGASTANEVTVVDTVPTGMKVVGTPTPAAIVAGNKITWHFGVIAPGVTEHLLYELEIEKPAKAASSFTNRVKATTQSLPEGEGGVPSQIRTAEFGEAGYESKAEDTVKLIGATVSKEVSPTEGTIGTSLTYKLHMLLPPEIDYNDTTVVDQLPSGIAYDEELSAECVKGCVGPVEGEELPSATGSENSTLLGWYFPKFVAGPERELVVEFKAHIAATKVGGAEVKAPETLTNKVVGLYNENPVGKPTETPTPKSNTFSEETNEAEAPTTVVEPNVTLEKAVAAEPAITGGKVQPGSKLTYTLTVGNTGTSTAYEVEVSDENTSHNLRNITPVVGAEHIKSAAGPLVWVLPEVKVGVPVTLTYTAELPLSGKLVEGEKVNNAAEVPSYFGLPEPERKEAKASRKYEGPKAGKNLEVALPKINVVKTTGEPGFPDEATAEVGKPFPWRVVVENESTAAEAKAVSVEDLLPPNWEYVAGSTEFKAVGAAKVATPAFDPTITGGESKVLTWPNVAELPAGPTAVEVLFKATPTVAAINHLPHQQNKAIGTFQDHSGATGSEAGAYEDNDSAVAHLLWPELGIHKAPDVGEAAAETVAGTADKYMITVENGGTGTAHEVEVKDVLSKGQEFVGPATANPTTGFAQKSVETNTPGLGETTVTWTIAEVPKELAGTVTIEVPIKTEPSLNDGEEVTDVATVSSPQQIATPNDPGSFEVHRVTDLSIEKKAVEPSVNAGEEIHYELLVKNHGPSDATGIVATDELPATTIFKGSDPECAEAGGEVTCEWPELKVGEEHTFKFTVEVKSGITEPIENTAKVDGDQPDEGPEPNESTKITPIGGLANLAIEKIGPEKPVLLGNDFTYEIKVENNGPSDAVNSTVEDELPPQVKFLSAAPSVGACDEAPAALLTCELGRMLPHAKATIVVTVEAAEVGGFMNVATFDSDTSPEAKEGEAPAEIVPAADLTIEKTAPATVEPDGSLTYSLHVENHGPSVAHKVKVADPLPAGVDFVSASEGCAAAGTTVTCDVPGELAVGDAADFQVTVHVPFALGGQALTNTATVGAEEGDPHPEDDSSTVSTTVGPAADLAITKTMGKAQAGEPLTYTLAVTNKGPSVSSAVTVKDTLPAGTTFKSATPSQGTCSAAGQAVTCQLGPLVSGGSAQVSITVEVAATATGSIRNVASVEGPEPDPDKSNNESAVEGPVDPPVATDPNLKVVKKVDTTSPEVGAPFTYHVEVSNMSGGEAKNVKVIDTLDGSVKVVSTETESGRCGAAGSTITCTIPSIPVGKTVNITYSVIAEAPGPLKNTVSAEAANGEKAPANNRAVKSVLARAAQAKYTLSKTASRKVVAGGKKVGFTITLRNGFAAMTNAKICDRLPEALVFVKAPGARYVNGEACWTKTYVAAHKVLHLHLIARAVKGYKSRQARNVATANADNAGRRSAAVAVRIKPAFAGKPGGVTG